MTPFLNLLLATITAAAFLSPISGDPPAVEVCIESSANGKHFQFDTIPLPAVDDAATRGRWKILAGRIDPNSGTIECLSDGQIPQHADQPGQNVFLAAGTVGGYLTVDFETPLEISEIVTYSWHTDSRGPQVYSVFAATGDEPGIAFPATFDAVDESTGWKKIADVDSRKDHPNGGQHAARIFSAESTLGKFRYLMFAVQATEPGNRFSQTFFSEIDVIAADAKNIHRITVPEVREIKFSTADDTYHFTIDVTQALELEDWTATELKPVIQEWYPRIVHMLPSERFEAAKEVHFRFLRDAEMKGIPAYASGNTISMNAEWFRGQLKGEARGAVVHEMVHVVQSYPGRDRRSRGIVAPPGWLTEGIPDYVRWFLYEPQTGGAKLSAEGLKNAKHDASYRISANFIDWVIRNHASDGRILEQLNAAARGGQYSSETWKELTGKSEQDLANAWRSDSTATETR